MIKSVEIHNFKSIRHLAMPLRSFMVLVGPNGAGKTNIVRALELLGSIVRNGTSEPVRSLGYDQIIRRKKRPAKEGLVFKASIRIELSALGRVRNVAQFAQNVDHVEADIVIAIKGSVYRDDAYIVRESIELRAGVERAALIVDKNGLRIDSNSSPKMVALLLPWDIKFEDTRAEWRSELSRWLGGDVGQNRQVLTLVNWQRFYSPLVRAIKEALDVTRIRLDGSALRSDSPIDQVYRASLLGPNGEGLATTIYHLKRNSLTRYENIKHALQLVYPRIEDIGATRTQTGRLILEFKEVGISDSLGQGNVSDGVLHALALLIALSGDSNSNGVLVIEEPENAIHPWSVRAMMQRAQQQPGRRQTIVTTHSETIVNAVADPEALFIVENDASLGTQAVQATEREQALKAILSDSGQSLGDVWLDGTLGGVPGSPGAE